MMMHQRNFFSLSRRYPPVAILLLLLSTASKTSAFSLSSSRSNKVVTNLAAVSETSMKAATNKDTNINEKKKKMAVLLCPAQFCVPLDYTDLLDTIQQQSQQHTNDVEIVATRTAPLPRTEWIKVAKQLPTKDFLDANLSVRVTLDWYFDAIEVGLSELFAEAGEDVEVCIIGHSIGGWVARAYLGGLSG